MSDVSRQVVGGLDAALVLADGEGAVLFANDHAKRLLGRDLTAARLRSDSFDDDLPILMELVERFRRDGSKPSAFHDLMISGEEDQVRYLWVTISPAGASGGRKGARLITLVDISSALTGSPAVRKVFSQVNHDLRSPLTSISGSAELLLSGRVGALEGTPRRLVTIIEESAAKMSAILAATKAQLARGQMAAGGEGHE